ncbi:serine esterase [Sarocladium implicatum]|nr:serine esterase [Sarocladium implicatum]
MWVNLNKAPPASYYEQEGRPSTASTSSSHLEPPPVYSAYHKTDLSDPRQSSQHSLVPSESDPDHEERRRLLVIYIHGFNGNSQSFRSFPAHVHNFLKDALSETHVVHTKLYPRYKTYRAVEVARDKFSEWLEPHEGPHTDVILVGHSMGGILAADVILIPNQNPQAQQPFKHRILGHVSLDCPFLGLHPGIIASGIASLFQPAPKAPQDPTYIEPRGSESTLAVNDGAASVHSFSGSSGEPRRPDPHFNAPFFNDNTYEERPFLQSVFSFIKKHHAEGVANSFAQRLMDQLEFGGCLADYTGLHARYKKLRALEDVDDMKMLAQGHPPGAYTQVRFVNYYTLSSGVPKRPKASADAQNVTQTISEQPELDDSLDIDPLNRKANDEEIITPRSGQSATPEEHITAAEGSGISGLDTQTAPFQGKGAETDQIPEQHDIRFSRLSMQEIDPTPMSDNDEPEKSDADQVGQADEPNSLPSATPTTSLQPSATEELNLPPLAEEPTPPVLPDLDDYTDKASRKQAEKESKRLQKAYEQALKDRAKSVREREKLIEKRRKETQKMIEKQDRQAQKEADKHEHKEKQRLLKEEQRLEKERQRMEREAQKLRGKAEKVESGGESSRSAVEADEAHDEVLSDEGEAERDIAAEAQALAPKKRKKFCTLPRKVNGRADEAWVDIYMENMNEVTAHCGLFFAGPHYDKLVGEVGSRIVGWVQEDLTKRAILNMPVD